LGNLTQAQIPGANRVRPTLLWHEPQEGSKALDDETQAMDPIVNRSKSRDI
jgi:hypothetical protein